MNNVSLAFSIYGIILLFTACVCLLKKARGRFGAFRFAFLTLASAFLCAAGELGLIITDGVADTSFRIVLVTVICVASFAVWFCLAHYQAGVYGARAKLKVLVNVTNVICAGLAAVMLIAFALAVADGRDVLFSIDSNGSVSRGSMFLIIPFLQYAAMASNAAFAAANREMLSCQRRTAIAVLILSPTVLLTTQIFLISLPAASTGLAVGLLMLSSSSDAVAAPTASVSDDDVIYTFWESVKGAYTSIISVDLETLEYTRITSNGELTQKERLSDWKREIERIIENQVYPDDREMCYRKMHVDAIGATQGAVSNTISYRRSNAAAYRWYETTLKTSITSCGKRVAIYLTKDIEDEMRERSHFKDISEHDSLTDLFNRVKLELMMNGEYRGLTSCGVLFFDVNGLKPLNDTRGHDEGDRLLCFAADSIRSITSRHVHAYRYGGDEFLVIAPNITSDGLEELLDLWRQRLYHQNNSAEIKCSVAVGSAWATGIVRVEELISKADVSMYSDKYLYRASNAEGGRRR